MKPLYSVLFVLFAGPALAEDIWKITTSEGLEVTQESRRADNRYAMVDLWEFSAADFLVRLAPDFEDGEMETQVFGGNNNLFQFPITIDGKTVRVSCDPAEDAMGSAVLTEITDELMSGSFEVELVSCENYETAESVEYDGIPITVIGEFSVGRKDM